MDVYILISFISLIFGFTGSIILTFRLKNLIKMIQTAIKAHENSLISISNYLLYKGNAYIYSGFDKQLENINKEIKGKTILGILLIFSGFIIQLINLSLKFMAII